MKIISFHAKIKQKKMDRIYSFDRVILTTFILLISLLVLVQIALLNSNVRSFLTIGSEIEGYPLQANAYLYKEGLLVLNLVNEDSNSRLKVLVNGDEVGSFLNRVAEIPVRNGDLIELDGSLLNRESLVVINSKSQNITTECVGKMVKVGSNIKKLVRVEMTK